MPLNGSGTYSAPASSWNPAVDNTDINSTDWAALLADLSTALSTALYKDGQQVPTANIPMGGFKLTGLGAGSSAGDSATIGRTETLTSKTLTAPTINAATLTGAISGGTFTASTFTNPANTTQALTDAAPTTWDASAGAIATWTMGASRTISAPTNLKTGGRYVLIITQDGTGGRIVTWNTVFKGSGGGSMPQPVLTASVATVFTFTSPDGTNLQLEQPTRGLDFIGSTTAAAASSVDFTNINASLYSGFIIRGDDVVPGTNAVNLLLRISIAGVFQSGGAYVDASWRYTPAAGSGGSGGTTNTGLTINSTSETLGTGTNQAMSFTLFFSDASSTAGFKKANWQAFYLSSNTTYIALTAGGAYATSGGSAVDGFRLIMSSGTISGTYTLLGIRK